MILLGKNPGVVQKHNNIEPEEDFSEYYLLKDALKRVDIEPVFTSPPSVINESEVFEDSVSTSSSSTTYILQCKKMG